jgi:hypothetical protein
VNIDRAQIANRIRADIMATRRILDFSLRRIRYAPLAIPVVLIAIVAYLVTIGALPGKPMMLPLEIAAIAVLAVALATAWWRWRQTREPYFLWLTCLIGALIVREIHLDGTSPPFYIALVALFYIAVIRYPMMAEYFASPTVLTLIAFVFFTYALSQALDRHFLAFIPHEEIFERPTEEFIEVVAHMALVLLTIFSRKGTEPLRLRSA